MIPDWLQPTILLLPALLWMCFGVGIPWALAFLPRGDWYRRVEVLAVALALGPALTTTGMFALGTFGHFTLANTLAVSILIALIGLICAARQRNNTSAAPDHEPLTTIDLMLIGVIGVAIILRFWNTAYWPYDNYDEFWVYGYNAKIFMLSGAIPASMGYYPQLVPLSLTYGQLAWGSLSEHAARTIVPYLGMGSILITYVLGARLFGRRSGLIGAAVWALYAHHASWAQYADLEVPVTLYFTGAAAYFIVSWTSTTHRRRYAILSGVFAGAALWTKPTAGALVESGALIGAAILFTIARKYRAELRSKIRNTARESLAVILATPLPAFFLALLPMGSMWYMRNIAFGHPPIVLPGGYWQDAAQRSVQELGWPLLVIMLLGLYLLARRVLNSAQMKMAVAGIVVLVIIAMENAFDPHPQRLDLVGYAICGFGGFIVLVVIRNWWRTLSDSTRAKTLLIYAFIVPYFVTWFWSYSYHYRLSFAMVPLFTAQVGVILDRLVSPFLVGKKRRVAMVAATITIAALPGWVATMSAWGFVISNMLPNDHAKQAIANPALLSLVDYLRAHRDPARPLKVEASAELRLPFFFPTDDIRTIDYPQWLDQIADVDYFVDSSVGERLYQINGLSYNQILASLTRDPPLHRVMTTDDGNFRFWLYTVNNAARFRSPTPAVAFQNTQIGDFARLLGWEISAPQGKARDTLILTLYWRALKPSNIDYSVYIHLWDAGAQKLIAPYGAEPISGIPDDHGNTSAYHMRLWQNGETIKDVWRMEIPKDTPPGTYDLRVGLFDPIGGRRLPITIDGSPAGDGLLLTTITVTP